MCDAKQMVNTKFLEEIGINAETFYSNLKTLAMKWLGANAPIDDCNGKRSVNYIFRKGIKNPMVIAIVANNINCFMKHLWEQESSNAQLPIFWLELACICGAKDIALFMLGKTGKIWTKPHSNIVPYALSSGNNEFALMIANLAKASSVTEVDFLNIYNFCDSSTLEEVKSMFSKPPFIKHFQ